MSKLDEWGQYDLWKSLSGIRDDKRMRGAELILRFLALTFMLDEYEKPLAAFLNKFSQFHRNASESEKFENAFRLAVTGVHNLMGEKAFRLLDETGAPENNFNSAVFDAQMVGFALSNRPIVSISKKQQHVFQREYHTLQQNPDYTRAISASTSDPPLVRLRIQLFKELVDRMAL